MAFNYAPSSNVGAQPLSFGSGINYGTHQAPQRSNVAQQTQLDYQNQFPAQQQGGGKSQQLDPQTLMKLMDQFKARQAASGSGDTGFFGSLNSGSGSAGLGGSGLIGSAGGATSAAANGGASYGLGGSLVGGTGTVGGSTFAAGSGSAVPAAGSGLMGGIGGLGALAGLSYLGDKEMNESKGSAINADKINDIGTIGKSGIGLRGGDLVNGFNPATWVSDPGKAAKGLVNVFTLGFLNKWL